MLPYLSVASQRLRRKRGIRTVRCSDYSWTERTGKQSHAALLSKTVLLTRRGLVFEVFCKSKCDSCVERQKAFHSTHLSQIQTERNFLVNWFKRLKDLLSPPCAPYQVHIGKYTVLCQDIVARLPPGSDGPDGWRFDLIKPYFRNNKGGNALSTDFHTLKSDIALVI